MKHTRYSILILLLLDCASTETLENYETVIEGEDYNVYVVYEDKEPMFRGEKLSVFDSTFQREEFLKEVRGFDTLNLLFRASFNYDTVEVYINDSVVYRCDTLTSNMSLAVAGSHQLFIDKQTDIEFGISFNEGDTFIVDFDREYLFATVNKTDTSYTILFNNKVLNLY